MSVCIPTGTEPRNEAEAQGSPDWPHWHVAMVKEVSKLTAKTTWELVDTPAVANIVSSRWMYFLKCNASGKSICYKGCLVVQGFTQATGINYDVTFAPVEKFISNHMVLAVKNGFPIQLNSKKVEIKQIMMSKEIVRVKLSSRVVVKEQGLGDVCLHKSR